MSKDLDDKLLSTMPMATASRRAYSEELDGGRISLLIYHHDATHVVSLAEGQRLVIGRDPCAELAIDDQNLSRRHACFEVQGGEVWVEDLGSTNGTTLNGKEIKRVKLGGADEVTMGSVTASIHVLLPLETRRLGFGNHDRLLLALEEEVARAHLFKRSAALLMIRFPGPLRGDTTRLSDEIRSHLRGNVDRLALYSDDTVEILLPEASLEQAAHLAKDLVQSELLCCDGPLYCGLSFYPDTGTSAEELLHLCRAVLREATDEQPVQLAPAQGSTWEAPARETSDEVGPVIRNEAMVEIYETIDRLSTSVIPVLLIGETGTGKEVLARAVHERGNRRAKRMACINCGAIPSTLVESVLFGHERGAFTGASQHNKGIFEEASGGTVLLDEIGELSPEAQAALLRVLETKQIRRVGSSKEITVDVRVIAATNHDLEAMCAEGGFREDLLYRINAMTLKIPPLCERPEEIAPLVDLFIKQTSAANGVQISGIEADAMRLLHHYPWPGNVRELRNAIERAVVIARGERIAIADLPQRVRELVGKAGPSAPAAGARAGADGVTAEMPELDLGEIEELDFKSRMQRLEAQVILDALRQADWNRGEAAKQLQMPVRTLSHKINQHGIRKLGYGLDESEE
jgi:two-component system, NtrC family, response regulator AtoC